MRVPPTERKGRVHTSTVTVAVFEGHLEPVRNAAIHPNDIHERITRGTGAGGQNRNKRETVVVLKHLPTGIEVKAESERTQEANRRVAMGTLAQRVDEHLSRQAKQQVSAPVSVRTKSGPTGPTERPTTGPTSGHRSSRFRRASWRCCGRTNPNSKQRGGVKNPLHHLMQGVEFYAGSAATGAKVRHSSADRTCRGSYGSHA